MRSEIRFAIFLLIADSTIVNFIASAPSPVVWSFRRAGIVPEVILRAPENEAIVVYPNRTWVNFGNELTPTQVKDTPLVGYRAAPKTFYTLAFIDPDVPSRKVPIFRELKLWLVVNIQGNNITSGETLAQYIGSVPEKDTGLHRYVFLVYKQPKLLKFDEPRLNNTSTKYRTSFSISNFALRYDLGDPVAGNFFQAQYEN